MSKFHGKIGFISSVEEPADSGIWVNKTVERYYYGNITQVSKRNQDSSNKFDDITLTNQLSIVADPFVNSNLQNIRYVEYMGCKWSISSVSVEYPRLNLSFGGVYNG